MIEYHWNNIWHGEWTCRGINKDWPFRPGYDACLSVTRAGKFCGGVIYDNNHTRTMQMHVSAMSKSWLTRDFLKVAFGYPFETVGVEKVYAPVETDNPHAMQFDIRLGFVEETRLVGAIPGGDIVILCMPRDQCRWLKHKLSADVRIIT